ncbi:hypothetical protein, partial [Azotobacter chroococcum]|uniref:hypothetical protein n=1 Tax=Azotobacter chroococcum TaxID=353 RepID=UPI001A9555CA
SARRAMTLAGACFSNRARTASHIVLFSRSIIGGVYANTLKGLALRGRHPQADPALQNNDTG